MEITLNGESLSIDTSDIDRLSLTPTLGSLIYLEDGRSGIVIRMSWYTENGTLTTATITTDNFMCVLSEVVYVDTPTSPVVENELTETI